MTLVLDIEYLLGVSFAARNPANDAPDWPPQPDRVFSALVAAWGARGERTEERLALEWLEQQSVPLIAASLGSPRTPATIFVPPNDPETKKLADRSVMPEFRRRQPRRFPAYRPNNATVRFIWNGVTADNETLNTLNALASDTAYIGHSSSLTRCSFHTNATDVTEPTMQVQRRIYRGRLAELEQAYNARPRRRPGPGSSVLAEAEKQLTRCSIFADQWLVLEHPIDDNAGLMPDLRAAALVSKAIHKAILSGYQQIGDGETIPPEVSGHAPDGTPFTEPHLAIVPLAVLGSQYADGRVLGFALIPPRIPPNASPLLLLEDTRFQRAFKKIAPWTAQDNTPEERGRRELHLNCDGFDIRFTPSRESDRRSLSPKPYIAKARTWASATPIVLDRHLKEDGNKEREREMEDLLRRACVNLGLPEPQQIALSKHSALEGAPSAYPSGNAPAWMGWRLPKNLASRRLVHAVLQFEEEVCGPVILGAGRFVGLGLCRALDARKKR